VLQQLPQHAEQTCWKHSTSTRCGRTQHWPCAAAACWHQAGCHLEVCHAGGVLGAGRRWRAAPLQVPPHALSPLPHAELLQLLAAGRGSSACQQQAGKTSGSSCASMHVIKAWQEEVAPAESADLPASVSAPVLPGLMLCCSRCWTHQSQYTHCRAAMQMQCGSAHTTGASAVPPALTWCCLLLMDTSRPQKGV
jgi:hypothetical protein